MWYDVILTKSVTNHKKKYASWRLKISVNCVPTNRLTCWCLNKNIRKNLHSGLKCCIFAFLTEERLWRQNNIRTIVLLSFAARRKLVCRPSNNRSTGGKRLFDGRKSPNGPMCAARFNQVKRPIELGHCPVAVGWTNQAIQQSFAHKPSSFCLFQHFLPKIFGVPEFLFTFVAD